VTAAVPVLAATYGQHGKIDQVMFAGHGDNRSLEQGATENGPNKHASDGLDLDSNLVATDRLLNTVLANMDEKGPHRRILLNACLTASNQVPSGIKISDDPKHARTQLSDAMKQNESLANHLKTLVGTRSIAVLGANASIDSVQMIDPKTGGLTLKSSDDPMVTGTKLEYAKSGIEPMGVVRAAIECWLTNPEQAKPVIATRANIVPTNWDQRLIHAHYSLLLSSWNAPDRVVALGDSICAWAELPSEDSASASSLLHSSAPDVRAFIAHNVERDVSWIRNPPHTALCGLQALLDTSAGPERVKQLVAHAGAHFTAQTADRFVNESVLLPHYSELLTNAAKPSHGALVGAKRHSSACLEYLRQVCGARPRFATALAISSRIGGLFAEPELNDWLDGNAIVKGARENVDLDGDGYNDIHVDPFAKRVRADAPVAICARPHSGDVLKTVPIGTVLQVTGESGEYWAVVQGKKTCFVSKRAALTDYLIDPEPGRP